MNNIIITIRAIIIPTYIYIYIYINQTTLTKHNNSYNNNRQKENKERSRNILGWDTHNAILRERKCPHCTVQYTIICVPLPRYNNTTTVRSIECGERTLWIQLF